MAEPKYKSEILRFFASHPLLGALGAVGSIASIIALPLAIWLWLNTPKPDLAFCISPVRTLIVQTAKTSDVGVTYKGVPVNGDVTAAQIAIWNAGRPPIRSGDVLVPIVLHASGDCKILEASVLKTNRPIVTEFRINTTNAALNDVHINWRILERGDGGLVQVVYSGSPEASFRVLGAVVGQSSPNELTKHTFHGLESFRPSFSTVLAASLMLPVAAVFASRLTTIWRLVVRKPETDVEKRRLRDVEIIVEDVETSLHDFKITLAVGLAIFVLLTLSVIASVLLNNTSIVTPFGF